jgi:uncharacterized protein YggU (UPF0235/DUF167 family)
LARPKADLPDQAALRALVDGESRLAVRVTPGARSEAVEVAGSAISVKVRARPEDGKATEAARLLLAEALGLAPSRVNLLRGATSREKQFHVEL